MIATWGYERRFRVGRSVLRLIDFNWWCDLLFVFYVDVCVCVLEYGLRILALIDRDEIIIIKRG